MEILNRGEELFAFNAMNDDNNQHEQGENLKNMLNTFLDNQGVEDSLDEGRPSADLMSADLLMPMRQQRQSQQLQAGSAGNLAWPTSGMDKWNNFVMPVLHQQENTRQVDTGALYNSALGGSDTLGVQTLLPSIREGAEQFPNSWTHAPKRESLNKSAIPGSAPALPNEPADYFFLESRSDEQAKAKNVKDAAKAKAKDAKASSSLRKSTESAMSSSSSSTEVKKTPKKRGRKPMGDPETRRLRKMEQNRQAATRRRQRKKNEEEQMKQALSHAMKEQQTLLAEIGRLQAHIQDLSMRLADKERQLAGRP
eukprot:Clim_evm4s33 gene=Clim_evmTU4s33